MDCILYVLRDVMSCEGCCGDCREEAFLGVTSQGFAGSKAC